MTEDYKETLIDYVTGNLENTPSTTDEIFKEIIEVNRSDWIGYIPSTYVDFHFENIIQDKNSDTLILYGGYRATGSTGINNEVYGIIVLLDNNFKPIKTFYEYESGTKLRYIQYMKQAEDNSFYMVDDTNFAYSYDSTTPNSVKRIVLLNNFCVKLNNENRLTLRTSYIIPSSYKGFKCVDLNKNPNSAQYVMIVAPYSTQANTWGGVATIEFIINYGQSPTWNWTDIVKFIWTTSPNELYDCQYITSFISFNEDKYSIKMIGFYTHNTNQQTTYQIKYFYKNYNNTSYSNTVVYDININNIIWSGERYILENQGIFINENECYFVLQNLYEKVTSTDRELKIILFKYNTNTNTLSTIYQNNYGTAPVGTKPTYQEIMFLSVNEGKLYIEQIINNQNGTGNYYIQRYEGIWNPKLIGENKNLNWNQRNLYVSNNYNLLKIFLYPTNPRNASWYFPVVKEIYNPTQYNGEPYIDTNALSPLYANLYSNGSLVFSRNLYNISKQNNMTMSSVEIPNNYLNNENITRNDLISETNLELNNNPKQWSKNIYETVDLNFLNTITVIDEDTDTQYLESAIKINNATTDGGNTNYQNTKCTKYRINYSDNTTSIENLTWDDIDETHKLVEIGLYVDKAMRSIDILSNDESVIYLTIPLNVVVGKYYTISQKIRIE